MRTVTFTKMQGAGNDFIMIDNRALDFPQDEKSVFASRLCPRALGVGADGLVFLEPDEEFDFRWDFYNADGSSAEMCGNASRCTAIFARQLGLAGETMTFRTIAGPIHATILADGNVTIGMTDAKKPEHVGHLHEIAGDVYFINTGVPHAVAPVHELETMDVRKHGAEIRYHNKFQPAGTNANFMAQTGENRIALRTYERGVEDETLACGTGSVACAIVAAEVYGLTSPVEVVTRSGEVLKIGFRADGEILTDVTLTGPAKIVYTGTLDWPGA